MDYDSFFFFIIHLNFSHLCGNAFGNISTLISYWAWIWWFGWKEVEDARMWRKAHENEEIKENPKRKSQNNTKNIPLMTTTRIINITVEWLMMSKMSHMERNCNRRSCVLKESMWSEENYFMATMEKNEYKMKP